MNPELEQPRKGPPLPTDERGPGRAPTARPTAGGWQGLAADIAMSGRVAAAGIVAIALPERFWAPLTRAIARTAIWLPSRWKRRELAELARRLGGQDKSIYLEVLTDRIALGHESRLLGLREYRPGLRKHRVRLSGAEYINEGLAAGNGVVLWVAPFVFGSLVTKIALSQGGFRVSHLSRPSHGFAESGFGVRYLNPLWTRVEERYVRERIVLVPGQETRALRKLRSRLAENQVVSISVGDEGVQTTTVPFLAAHLRLATGPITLAAAAGASLIPAFAVRDGTGTLCVELGPPLEVAGERDRQMRLLGVSKRYAERLAPYVRQYPGQWLG